MYSIEIIGLSILHICPNIESKLMGIFGSPKSEYEKKESLEMRFQIKSLYVQAKNNNKIEI